MSNEDALLAGLGLKNPCRFSEGRHGKFINEVFFANVWRAARNSMRITRQDLLRSASYPRLEDMYTRFTQQARKEDNTIFEARHVNSHKLTGPKIINSVKRDRRALPPVNCDGSLFMNTHRCVCVQIPSFKEILRNADLLLKEASCMF